MATILAIRLCEMAQNHDEWVEIMHFGMESLLEDREILIQCIFDEATRQKTRGNNDDIAGIIADIFEELELTITAR